MKTLFAATAAAGAAGLLFVSGTAAPGWAQTATPPAAEQQAGGLPQSFAPLINRVKPAVVNISTTELRPSTNSGDLPQLPQFPPGSPFGEFFRMFPMPNQGAAPSAPLKALGSGFIIDPNGTIVTNNHVIRNGTKIEVTLQDGTTLKAKVIGHDKLTDLAVLKVDADHPLPYVPLGDSDRTEVGDWVVSVGNPFGLGGTVTAGIISARGRDIHEGPYDDFLQIDAPINQGNSGGPTFDENGRVIGVNTAIFSPNGGGSVGIGFAIPSNVVKPVVAELEKSGKIVRGWLGVAVESIRPDMEDALNVTSTNGALVASVNNDSPAARAGLKAGDIITAYDGKPVNKVRDLTWSVANTAPGKTVDLTITRGGETTNKTVSVGQLGGADTAEQVAAADHQPQLGLQLKAITPQARQEFDLPANSHGVLITGVAPGGPADQAGLKPGDIIEQVNRATVQSPRQVIDAVRSAAHNGKKSIAVTVNRDGQDQFVPVPLGGEAS